MKWILAGVFVSLLSLASCRRHATGTVRIEGATMGTTYAIQVLDLTPALDAAGLRARVEAALARIEHAMSTYDPDSELARFNASATTEWFPVSADTRAVIVAALDVHARTEGAFDVTVGPLVELWGFGPRGARRRPSDTAVAGALVSVGSSLLETCASPAAIRKRVPGVRVDLSGIAKGFAVDEVARVLAEAGARRFLVEIGGELRAAGTNAARRPWRIAVERPGSATSAPPCVLELVNSAVATSGDYRNAFVEDGVRYTHVLDPRTGEPVTSGVVSATVVAPSAMEADALATALLVLSPDEGLSLAAEGGLAVRLLVRVGDALVERRTSGFPGVVP